MNSKGIHLVHQAMVPVRSHASDPAEMVTQLLFGDLVEVLSEDRQWREVRNLADGYTGWIDSKMILSVSPEWVSAVSHWEFVSAASLPVFYHEGKDTFPLHLHTGCRIPVMADQVQAETRTITIGDWGLKIAAAHTTAALPASRDNLLSVAFAYLGAPYLWGGKSLWGIDCSGFTQMIFARCGVSLPRDASQQVHKGIEIPFGEHQPGDVAFFQNEKGKVTHVGIILHDNRIRHAAGHVHDDMLTSRGIYINSSKTLTHVLYTIKRIH